MVNRDLGHDIFDAAFNGLRADAHVLGDLLFRKATSEMSRYLHFPRGELLSQRKTMARKMNITRVDHDEDPDIVREVNSSYGHRLDALDRSPNGSNFARYPMARP